MEQVDSKAYRYALLQVSVERFGKRYNKLPEKDRSEVEKIANKQCEIHDHILNSPEASKVTVSEARVIQEIQTITARFTNESSFEQELKANGLDDSCFEQLVRRGLRVEAVMDFVASSVEPCNEVSASLFYYMNTDKFQQPELREARHILITVNPDFPENEREAAIKRANQIAARLKKKPARFADQALQHSECPTAMNGGHLGVLKRGVLFPTLDEVLFNQKLGEVSDIIESPLGFHILMCESIQSEGIVPLAKALPQIVEKLTERNQKMHQRNWLSSLFKTH
jgi:peptidyl-prolyl cis-trans isomerase C